MTPFALRRADQFRPGPPPSLTSATYAAALDEVASLGEIGSTTRSADQTQIARFWAAPIQNYWNEIAQTAALQHGNTLPQNARLFALLDLSLADSVIAFYDAKYAYHAWRPVTAIRAERPADANWTPLAATALDPSYPGAHAVVSAAGADVLATFFHDDNDNLAVPPRPCRASNGRSRASLPLPPRRATAGSSRASTSDSTRSPASSLAVASPTTFSRTF